MCDGGGSAVQEVASDAAGGNESGLTGLLNYFRFRESLAVEKGINPGFPPSRE